MPEEPNGRRKRPEPVKTVARQTIDQRRYMLAGVLCDRDTFLSARHRLKPEFFNRPDEVHLRAVWTAALSVAEANPDVLFSADRNAAWNALDVAGRSLFVNQPEAYPVLYYEAVFQSAEEGRPPGFLEWVYKACQPTEFDSALTTTYLRDFLQERTVSDELHRLAADSAGRVLSDVTALVQTLRDRELDIAAMGEDPVENAAPAGWLPPPSRRRSTGITWLDALLRGGHAAPETYGLLGVTGAGKTTFGLQLLSSTALYEQLLAADTPEARDARVEAGLDPDAPYEMGHCYYFHYEMPVAEIRKKLWSGMASIDIDRIDAMGRPGFSLSTAANLSTSDAAMLSMVAKQFKLGLSDFPGEQERLEIAKVQMQRNMWLVDCTGTNSKNPRRGTGYIPELHAILANEVHKKKRRVALVVIDYAGACVDRHTVDKDLGYALLTQFGRRTESELSVPFQTPVWVLHQLAGAEGGRTSATRQHHANAGGSKRFAENLWFCFNIGTADAKTGCRYMTASKARRSNLGNPPIVKIAGGFNRIVDVSQVYEFDQRSRIRPKLNTKAPEADLIVAADEAAHADSGDDGAPSEMY